jgi:hypothetical protein
MLGPFFNGKVLEIIVAVQGRRSQNYLFKELLDLAE